MLLQIFEHILIHGDIRKTTKLAVAGEEIEVEEFVEEEDEDTVKHSTTKLANRESFVNMGKNLRQKVMSGLPVPNYHSLPFFMHSIYQPLSISKAFIFINYRVTTCVPPLAAFSMRRRPTSLVDLSRDASSLRSMICPWLTSSGCR